MKVFLTMLALAAVAGTPAFASADPMPHPETNEVQTPSIQVIDANGNPVALATVTIGEQKNTLTTDANGEFKTPKGWTTPLPVTVEASNHVTTTFQNVLPGAGRLEISLVDGQKFTEVSGVANNFKNLRIDGFVDFALVLPIFDRRSILQFDVSMVISPESDTLKLPGNNKFDIPSNISLPPQKEKYGFFTIHFQKPTYRFFFRNEGPQQMVAAHGRFPLKRVIRDFQAKKSIFEIMNHFKFVEAGTQDVDIKGLPIQKDIPIDGVQFDQTLKVKAPRYDSKLIMTSVALAGDQDAFYPTDIKSVKPGRTQRLQTASQESTRQVLNILSPPLEFSNSNNGAISQQKPMSFALSQETQLKKAPEFLDLGVTPSYNNGVISAQSPQDLPGIHERASYVILSKIESIGTGGINSEKRTRLMEYYIPEWKDSIFIPNAAELNLDPAHRYRWEVLYLGSDQTQNNNDQYTLDTVTHVSRSSLDF